MVSRATQSRHVFKSHVTFYFSFCHRKRNKNKRPKNLGSRAPQRVATSRANSFVSPYFQRMSWSCLSSAHSGLAREKESPRNSRWPCCQGTRANTAPCHTPHIKFVNPSYIAFVTHSYTIVWCLIFRAYKGIEPCCAHMKFVPPSYMVFATHSYTVLRGLVVRAYKKI